MINNQLKCRQNKETQKWERLWSLMIKKVCFLLCCTFCYNLDVTDTVRDPEFGHFPECLSCYTTALFPLDLWLWNWFVQVIKLKSKSNPESVVLKIDWPNRLDWNNKRPELINVFERCLLKTIWGNIIHFITVLYWFSFSYSCFNKSDESSSSTEGVVRWTIALS